MALAQSFNFEEDWRWSHFTVEDGLPANNIMQTDEDQNGTLWSVSLSGIAWFDGYSWVTLDSRNGLPQENILSVDYFGAGKNITVGYADKMFSGNTISFSQIKNLGHSQAITAYKEGYIFLNHDGEMSYYKDGISQLLRKNTFELFHNRSGDMWFASDSSIYFLSNTGTTKELLKTNNYIRLYYVAENSHKNGLLVIERPRELEGIWEWDSSRTPIHNRSEKSYNIVTYAINENNDVICVYKSGDVRIRINNKWTSPPYLPLQLRHSKKITFSKTGDLWLSTDDGTYVFRNSPSLWVYRNQAAVDLKNNINEILPLKNGDIWLGTGDGLLIEHPDGTEQWISEIEHVQIGAVTGLAQDNDGNIWVTSGSTFSGAFQWNGARWKHFDIGTNPNNLMFHRIYKDKKGNLWFLGLNKKWVDPNIIQSGVFVYQNGNFLPWGDIHHLPGNRVYSFSEGIDSLFWFATIKGIFCWDGKQSKDGNDSWREWSTTESGLIFPRVFTLVANKRGEIFFGHGLGDLGFGLGKIDSSGTISYFTVKDGLIEEHVNDLAIDSSETIWISSNAGLTSYKDGVWNTFGENTGLICPLVWPVKPFADKVYVGTSGKGLAILNRKSISSTPPKIHLSAPFVEDAKVYLNWKVLGFMGVPEQENIQTRYNLNNTGWSNWSTNHSLSMYNLEPGNYIFQVQARDIYGQYAENGSHTSFTILPPLWKRPIFFFPSTLTAIAFLFLSLSYYTRKRKSDIALRKSEEKFRVVSETTPSAIFIFNESAILYVNPSAVHLTGYQLDVLLQMKIQDIIHPQYHHLFNDKNTITSNLHHTEVNLIRKDHTEHWIEMTTSKILFQGDDAILAAMFDVTERKNSEHQLRSLAFELSRTEERERRHLASYLHDTISQNLAFLKLKFRTFAKSSPEPEENVEEMKSIIENLIQDSQTLTFELSPPILVELGLKAALDWLSERILERHRIQCIIQYHVTTLISYEIQSLLFHSIQELTTNVVKHAKATQIIVSVSTENSSTIIEVNDNGIGFNKIPSSQTIGKTNGFGLFQIRQRISALGGTLKFQSIQPTGSQVSISIPNIHIEGSLEQLTH